MSNKSQAIDQRNAGSDDSAVAGVGSASTQSGVSLSGFGTVNTLGHNLSGANNVTIADGGAFDLARDLTSKYTTTLTDYLAQSRETETAATTSQNSLLGGLVESFGKLVESKNTAGDSSRNSIVLWLGLGLLAVLGLFLLRKRA